MKKLVLILLCLAVNQIFSQNNPQTRPSGTLSNPSNYVLIDLDGNSYNLDSLLDAGKHIVLHTLSQT